MTHKDLLNVAEITAGRIKRSTVFADFLAISAYTISNCFDPVHHKKRQAALETLLRNYRPEERRQLNEALRALTEQIKQNVLHDRYVDLLGPVFMELGSGNKDQDFTPQDVCKLAARLGKLGQRELPEKGYFTFSDSTCGSGAMTLSAVQEMVGAGINPVYQLVVQMEDLDFRCVHMAYIQMSLYGIPAVVIRGNVITLEEFDRWYTPAYILFNWVWREPLPFQPGNNRDIELLKMSVEPTYRAIRLLREENYGK